MHPLLAASLINSVSDERVSVAKTRRTAKTVATAPGPGDSEPGEVIIRRASASDSPALIRLAALDGDRRAGQVLAASADRHAVLVAEVDGELEAALAVDSGVSVADPFRASAPHRQLLALRARQLAGAAPRRGRRARLGVLRPHTS